MFDPNLLDKKLFNQEICISTRGVTHSQNQFPLDITIPSYTITGTDTCRKNVNFHWCMVFLLLKKPLMT